MPPAVGGATPESACRCACSWRSAPPSPPASHGPRSPRRHRATTPSPTATPVSGLPYSDAVDMTGATAEAGEPQFCFGSEQTAWYAVTPASDGMLGARATGGFSSAQITAYSSDGSGLGGLSFLGCQNFGGAQAVFEVQAGQTYYLQGRRALRQRRHGAGRGRRAPAARQRRLRRRDADRLRAVLRRLRPDGRERRGRRASRVRRGSARRRRRGMRSRRRRAARTSPADRASGRSRSTPAAG